MNPEQISVGDRVTVVSWPEKPGEPSELNGLEGLVVNFRAPYFVVKLDAPPDWHEKEWGLYCRPEELEKL